MANRTTTSTPNMSVPTEKKNNSRVPLGLVLTFLLPPVGLVYLWREGVFRTRGRMLLTLMATIEMTVLLIAVLPKNQLIVDLPVPGLPVAATSAPDNGIVDALSNIDELLAKKQAEEYAAAGIEITPEPTDQAAYLAEQEAILNTTVYSVYGHAIYYHQLELCGDQSNRRVLTVREAMNENMGACPRCNPPVYGKSSLPSGDATSTQPPEENDGMS